MTVYSIESESNTVLYRQPSLTYKWNDYDVTGKITGLEAVKQSVQHILMSERYSSPIYSDSYGVELEQYLGKDFGYIMASIETTLRDALLQDDRITNVIVTDVSKLDSESCIVSFMVYTIYGNYKGEMNVL